MPSTLCERIGATGESRFVIIGFRVFVVSSYKYRSSAAETARRAVCTAVLLGKVGQRPQGAGRPALPHLRPHWGRSIMLPSAEMPGRGGAQGSSSVVETACVEARPEGFCVLHPLCGLRYLEDLVHRRDWIYLALILALLLLVLWIDLFSPVIAFWRPVPEESDPQQAQELKVAIRATSLRLGLDLQGGMQVILEAQGDTSELDPTSMDVVRDIVGDRVNGLGVTEAVVQRQGDWRIVAELPGVTDPQQALAALQNTGFLEFVDILGQRLPDGTTISTTQGLASGEIAAITWTTVYPTVVTGDQLVLGEIAVGRNPITSEPEVYLAFNAEGTRVFSEWTRDNVGLPLAIVLDKQIVSAPYVREQITDGRAAISGGDTDYREAQRIALLLRYGALPVPLEVVENRTVGPTLGQDSVNRSTLAGVIGLCAVLLFMVLYYRLPGVLASMALGIYTLLIFAIYKLIPVTLTLPGIAGLLLSIGMAVDANILIFERMKEELRAGKSLHAAIEAGFDRAWTSILDSNLSTLLTCLILYVFGSSLGASVVKGFAITLAIGVLVSMFSAITVTRTFLRLTYYLAGAWLERRARLLLGMAVERG